MSTITLRRTGNTPYKIDDDHLLFDEDSGTTGSKRWHWLRVFRSSGPLYVVAIEYRSEFEPEHCAIFELSSLETLSEALYKYDPTKYALGLPARTDADLAKNTGRNRQLYDDLKNRWIQLVAQAAAIIGLTKPLEQPTPTKPEEPSSIVSIQFTEALLADIDALRGTLSREDFVRLATEKFIQIKKM
jgi:hypothetical protein